MINFIIGIFVGGWLVFGAEFLIPDQIQPANNYLTSKGYGYYDINSGNFVLRKCKEWYPMDFHKKDKK